MRVVSSGSTGLAVLRREANEGGFFRLIVKEVVEKYLDCGNPRCGFARIRCPDCAEERLVMFSCRARGFCPSCHAKRIEEWGEWMRETLLLDVPHRQIVFTIPKRLRVFFKFNRRLLGDLCRCALRSLSCYFEVVTGSGLTPGVIAAIQTFGDRINLHVHLHFLVTEGGVDEAGVFHKIPRIDDWRLAEIFARVTSHILDKGRAIACCYALCANALSGEGQDGGFCSRGPGGDRGGAEAGPNKGLGQDNP